MLKLGSVLFFKLFVRVFDGSKGEREARLRGCEVVLSSEFLLLLVPRSSVLS